MIAHSVAVRAAQTAAEIGGELGLNTHEFEGIHEVQVGDLENRNDDEAITRSSRSTSTGTKASWTCRCPAGDRQPGARPLRAGAHAAADALPRR